MNDAEVVATVGAATREPLVITGRAAEGTSGGAIFVDLGDGRPGVITRFLGSPSQAALTADVVNRLRVTGLPLAHHRAVVRVGPDVFLVQERLPGRPPETITVAVIDAVVAVNDRFAGALADRPDVPGFPSGLDATDDDPRRQVLAGYSDRSRRVLAAITAIGRGRPSADQGDDLVHVDLDLSNLLFVDGAVTGVVDWNLGVHRGDRRLALVKTRFELEWALQELSPDPGAVAASRRLDEILTARVPADVLRWFWASRQFHQLAWRLRSGPPEVAEWHLAVAEERLV